MIRILTDTTTLFNINIPRKGKFSFKFKFGYFIDNATEFRPNSVIFKFRVYH